MPAGSAQFLGWGNGMLSKGWKLDPDARHLMPIDDLREHVASPQCWCRPIKDCESARLNIHNSLDRREDDDPSDDSINN